MYSHLALDGGYAITGVRTRAHVFAYRRACVSAVAPAARAAWLWPALLAHVARSGCSAVGARVCGAGSRGTCVREHERRERLAVAAASARVSDGSRAVVRVHAHVCTVAYATR